MLIIIFKFTRVLKYEKHKKHKIKQHEYQKIYFKLSHLSIKHIYPIKCKLKGLLFLNISKNKFSILMWVGLSNKAASSHLIGKTSNIKIMERYSMRSIHISASDSLMSRFSQLCRLFSICKNPCNS